MGFLRRKKIGEGQLNDLFYSFSQKLTETGWDHVGIEISSYTYYWEETALSLLSIRLHIGEIRIEIKLN